MKGNVLVIGNAGVGKSTLINAVLGHDAAITGYGQEGTTRELAVYQQDSVPFRLIDSVGFEPSLIKEFQAIRAVNKWSKNMLKANADNAIHMIWFCIDGTSSRLYQKTLKNLQYSTMMWPSVPIIIVITKSYSFEEREKNIKLIRESISKNKKLEEKTKAILPVVASTYRLTNSAFIGPEGIDMLIDKTIELLPQGYIASYKDVEKYKLNRKRALAHGLVGVSTAGAAIVGAVPIPFADGIILAPLEVSMINAISNLYGIKKDTRSIKFVETIIGAGTVGLAAKTAISAIKAIPGLNLGAAVINSIIAASIVAAIGEVSILAFENINAGRKSIDDIAWVSKLVDESLSNGFAEKVSKVLGDAIQSPDPKSITKSIVKTFLKQK